MNRNLTYLFLLGLVVAAPCGLAQTPRPTSVSAARRGQNSSQPGIRGVKRTADLPPADADGRRPAMVLLTEPSMIERLAAQTPTRDAKSVREQLFSPGAEQHGRELRQAKTPLVAQMRARGIPVRSQTEHALNAVMVDASEAELAWLQTLSGVRSAVFARQRHAHLNAATALVGANTAWTQTGGSGNAGRGVKIAILDSGIDITNPMLSGSGFSAPSGFPKFTAGNPGDQAYTNAKVIVARNYICPTGGRCAGLPADDAVDHTAADGFGHGTGVASIAAGDCAVTPLGTSICGVAPGAYLGSYKIVNIFGITDDTRIIQAMNDAVADGMNVVNFSGGNNGTGDLPSLSIFATLIKNIAAAGVSVVVSAGNCGPVGASDICDYVGDNTIADPGIVADAITVGSSSNRQTLATKVTVTSSSVTIPAGVQAIAGAAACGDCTVLNMGQLTPSFSGAIGPAVVVDVATLDNTGFACNPLPPGSLTGKIALVRWSFDICGITNSPIKISNAQAAGAIGVIIMDNTPENVNAFQSYPMPGGAIPSVLITYQDGANLQALVSGNPGKIQASLNGAPAEAPQAADLVSDFSSRGPANDFTIKPDLVAPGDLFAAVQKAYPAALDSGGLYDPTGFQWGQGTSYSAPMVAGAAAIVIQLRPTFNAYDIKSALVNTAAPLTATQDGSTISVMHQGGGRLNIPPALSTTLTAKPVSVSFGLVAQPAAGYTQTQNVTLKSVGATAETFNVTVNQGVSISGLKIGVPATISMTPGGSTTLAIQIALSAPATGVYEGTVNLTSSSTATAIHIPYWVLLGAPALTAGGLVDSAGSGARIAPGSMVTLSGTAMGTTPTSASRTPLPGGLVGGVTALFGGFGGSGDLDHTVVTVLGNDTQQGFVEQQVPMFYSSANQITFQVPYTLTTGNADAPIATCPNPPCVQVYVAGYPFPGIYNQSSISFPLSATAPGIFTTSGTNGVVVHQNGSLVTATSPALTGEAVTIYCAGLGAVSPTVYAGDPGPYAPLAATTAQPTVTIGTGSNSVQAAVGFSGLAPGLAGVYQIDATIPVSAVNGAQSLTVTMGGNTSNAVTTFVQVKPISAIGEERTGSLRGHSYQDPATGLVWLNTDNGVPVDQFDAVKYCQTLIMDGVSGWQLPSIDELIPMYSRTFQPSHVKGGIKLSASLQWSSTISTVVGGQAYAFLFDFGSGNRLNYTADNHYYALRAICVRKP